MLMMGPRVSPMKPVSAKTHARPMALLAVL